MTFAYLDMYCQSCTMTCNWACIDCPHKRSRSTSGPIFVYVSNTPACSEDEEFEKAIRELTKRKENFIRSQKGVESLDFIHSQKPTIHKFILKKFHNVKGARI